MARISLEILDRELLENFNDIKLLSNRHIVSHLMFFTKKNKLSLTKSTSRVIQSIRDYCEKRSQVTVHPSILKKKILHERTLYRTQIRNKKRVDQHSKSQRRDFIKMFGYPFADG